MANKNKIVLFFPAYNSNEACPPLALISIAAPLISKGYEVKIVDSTLEEDMVGAVLRELDDAICLGMSLVTGPMLKGQISAASHRLGRLAPLHFTGANVGGRLRRCRGLEAGRGSLSGVD